MIPFYDADDQMTPNTISKYNESNYNQLYIGNAIRYQDAHEKSTVVGKLKPFSLKRVLSKELLTPTDLDGVINTSQSRIHKI